MTELEELQEIWNRPLAHIEKGDEEIAALLNLKGRSLVSRLRQSVWFELTVTGVASILLIAYLFTVQSAAMRSTIFSLITLFLIFIYVYTRKLWILRHFTKMNGSLHENIVHVMSRTRKYIRFFYGSYIILYPLFYCLTLSFVALETGWDYFKETFITPGFIADLVVFLGVYIIVAFWLTRWYLQRLFGDYLQQLNKILDDLGKLEEQPGHNNAEDNL